MNLVQWRNANKELSWLHVGVKKPLLAGYSWLPLFELLIFFAASLTQQNGFENLFNPLKMYKCIKVKSDSILFIGQAMIELNFYKTCTSKQSWLALFHELFTARLSAYDYITLQMFYGWTVLVSFIFKNSTFNGKSLA